MYGSTHLCREVVVQTGQLCTQRADSCRFRDDEQSVADVLEEKKESNLAPTVVASQQLPLRIRAVRREQNVRRGRPVYRVQSPC
jgi:hypothetical protein